MAPRIPARHRPKKQPVQARSRATFDALVEATARVLTRRGYARLTTNHVAERAGVSIGTLYEWFPGKEALVATVLTRHLDRAQALLGERAAELVSGALCAEDIAVGIAEAMVELHEDDPRLHRVLSEEVPVPAALRARVAALEGAMIDALTALLSTHPELSHPQPRVAACMIVGLLEAATHRWATDPAGLPLERAVLIDELARMIVGYVGTR